MRRQSRALRVGLALMTLVAIPFRRTPRTSTAPPSSRGPRCSRARDHHKRIEDIRVVVSGAGAAGIACSKFYVALGVRPENLVMCDTKGVVYKGRAEGMNPYKEQFARDTKARTLADALKDADLFLGLSGANLLKPEWLKTMNRDPIVFAMANPDPEITYPEAVAARQDVIRPPGAATIPTR